MWFEEKDRDKMTCYIDVENLKVYKYKCFLD